MAVATRGRRGRGLTLLSTTFVVLVLVLFGYYFVRSRANQQRLDQRNLRELARIARAVEGPVNNLEKVVDSLAGVAGAPVGREADDPPKRREELVERVALIPDLELTCFGAECCASELQRRRDERGGEDRLLARLDDRQIHILCSSCGSSFEPEDEAYQLAVSWDLDRQLRSVLRSEFFDQILLAGPGGDVLLYQPQGSSVRIERLARSELELLERPEDEETAAAKPDRRVSSVDDVRLAGADHRLFYQPLDITLPGISSRPAGDGAVANGTGDQAPTWAVGGLVSRARFRAESLALDPPHLVFLILLLVFAVLLLPFLRTLLMGPRERLRVRDVMTLGISYVVVAGVVGMLLADVALFGNLEETADEGLKRIATRLHDNLQSEIRRSLAELVAQSSRFSEGLPDELPEEWPSEEWPWLFASPLVARTTSVYPHFQMVYWTDPCGTQVAKWTPRLRNTPLIPVARRDYFQRIRDGRGWPWPEKVTANPSGEQYYLESIRSLTTGELQAVLSTPFAWPFEWPAARCASPTGDRELGIAAMIIPPLSLQGVPGRRTHGRALLPPGIEFAVIEPDGRTLFHSRPERNLEESFFAELEDSHLLRSAATARVEHRLDANYLGREQRLFIRPVDGTELLLVVALDKTHLGTLHFEALFIGGLLLVVYALAVLVLFVVVEMMLHDRLAWAWPDRQRAWKHRLQCGLLALFAGELLLQLAWPHLLPLHPSSFLVPVQALGLGLVVLTCRPTDTGCARPSQGQWRDGYWIGWAIALFATALLLASHLFTAERSWLLLALQLAVTGVAVSLVRLCVPGRRETAPDARGSRGDASGRLRRRLRLETAGASRNWYVGTLALIPVLLGALPGYLVVNTVFTDHLELLVRNQQYRLTAALEDRDRVFADWRGRDRLPAAAADVKLDLAFPYPKQNCFRRRETRARWLCDRVLDPDVDRIVDEASPTWGAEPWWPGADGDEPQAEVDPGSSAAESLHRSFLHEEIEDRVPFVTTAAVDWRQLAAGVEGHRWWRPRRDTLRLAAPAWEMASELPRGLGRPTLPWSVAAVLALALLFVVSRWLGRRVFLVELSDAPPLPIGELLPEELVKREENDKKDDRPEGEKESAEPEGEEKRHPCLLYVCTRSTDRSLLAQSPSVQYVNLIDQWRKRAPLGRSPVDHRTVCFDFLDHRFEDPEWNRWLLDQLEELLYVRRRPLVLLTSRNPEDLFSTLLEGDDAARWEELRRRWRRLLGSFVRLHVKEEGEVSPTKDDWLHEETRHTPMLGVVGRQLEGRESFAKLDEDGRIDELRTMAAGYYEAVWTILSRDERLVLAQLASGAVASPASGEAIRRLLARGFLIRDPELRLMNESFGRYLRDKVPPERLAAWEREGTTSAWQHLRFPLLFGLAAVTLFLVATQAELFNEAMAFVSSIALTAGAVLRVLMLLRRSPAA